MAVRPGTRAEPATDVRPAATAWLFAAGRATGFALLSGAAMTLLAAVVLVPEYADLAEARYNRDRLRAETRDMTRQIEANKKTIYGLQTDPVLTKRVAMYQGTLWPENSVVVVSRDPPSAPPHITRVPASARPDPPSPQLMRLRGRLRNPGTVRGLMLISGALLAVALFLFAPPASRQRGDRSATDASRAASA